MSLEGINKNKSIRPSETTVVEKKASNTVQGSFFNGHTINWIQNQGKDFIGWVQQSFSSVGHWIDHAFEREQAPIGNPAYHPMEAAYFAPPLNPAVLPEFDAAKENEGAMDQDTFENTLSKFLTELNLSGSDNLQTVNKIIEKFENLPPMSIAQKRQFTLVIADRLSEENKAAESLFEKTNLYDSASKGTVKALAQKIEMMLRESETTETVESITQKIDESLLKGQYKDQAIFKAYGELTYPMTVVFMKTMMYRDAVMNSKGGRVMEDVKELINSVKNIQVEEGKHGQAVDEIMKKIAFFEQYHGKSDTNYAVLKIDEVLSEPLKGEFAKKGYLRTAQESIPYR